jgi:hypothetical protein
MDVGDPKRQYRADWGCFGEGAERDAVLRYADTRLGGGPLGEYRSSDLVALSGLGEPSSKDVRCVLSHDSHRKMTVIYGLATRSAGHFEPSFTGRIRRYRSTFSVIRVLKLSSR